MHVCLCFVLNPSPDLFDITLPHPIALAQVRARGQRGEDERLVGRRWKPSKLVVLP